MPFNRLLIANRGEIACRIARTARQMGLHTIAVFSQADANALHVRACDQAVGIDGHTAAESYLRIDALIEAARRSGAQAVHPGYGFLSENAHFAERCEQEGLIFVGPPAAAIRAMGSKSQARTLMARAGVAITPGFHGDDQDPARLRTEADRIGYPVLIKARHGGGGRGIRRVDRPEDFAAALASCQREARASFGDEAVLVEKCILRPRHIEFQVFADTHGHCVHLFERDCSVQRRHQKVLEEAPAPGMTAERRALMGTAAVSAATAVGYVGAGTVEFIVSAQGEFYFMEMNTRLQVEHPVTEMITGLDLVAWQLRVAAGEPLPLRQDQLAIHGHAIEARIAAEDPDRGFLPAVGQVAYLAMPELSARVRVDSGIAEGSIVTPYYDSLLAKLIVWGEDRDQALRQMRMALTQLQLVGVANNVEFLGRLIASPAFAGADLDTSLIEREHPMLFPAPAPIPREAWLAAAVATLLQDAPDDGPSPWAARDGWRLGGRSHRNVQLRCGADVRCVGVAYQPCGWLLTLEGRTSVAFAHFIRPHRMALALDGVRSQITVAAHEDALHLFHDGHAYRMQVADTLTPPAQSASGTAGLRAPMPGRILELLVAPGAIVAQGAPLLVLEAMKVEQTITAPSAGVLRAFRVAAGDQVTEGAELVDFEAAS